MVKKDSNNQAYSENIHSRIEKAVRQKTGREINFSYGDIQLKNPLIVAPGQLTRTFTQLASIKRAGYGGCVLKSVVGEDKDGRCSMLSFRKPATRIDSVYDNSDTEQKYPIIHWDGKLDTRPLGEFLEFAGGALQSFSDETFTVIPSILCHLPTPGEELKKDEWLYTAGRFFRAGYRHIEIDFCPQLTKEKELFEKENILRWYNSVTATVKSLSNEISVFPKIMNMDYGLNYQIMMMTAAVEGGADGLVISNRMFKHEFNCAHGGVELKERNIEQVKKAKKLFPSTSISATGGIYTGEDVMDYLKAGASNIQFLSLLMGKTSIRLPEKGSKFEKVLHSILFDPSTGLLNKS